MIYTTTHEMFRIKLFFPNFGSSYPSFTTHNDPHNETQDHDMIRFDMTSWQKLKYNLLKIWPSWFSNSTSVAWSHRGLMDR